MLMQHGMKLFLMPQAPSWWVWTGTAVLLTVGVSGRPEAFLAAIALCMAQAVFVAIRERDLASYPVQIRVAATALLGVMFAPPLRCLYWVPLVGTWAFVLFGYCLMARLLSLMPWNRRAPFTFELLRRTLLTPPVVGLAQHGLPTAGCPGGAKFAPANGPRPTPSL